MTRRQQAILIFAITPFSAWAPAVDADTHQWANPVNGTWHSGVFWNPSVVPDPGDTAVINVSAYPYVYTVTLDSATTIENFTLASGDAIFEASGKTFYINGLGQLSAGDINFVNSRFDGSGTLQNYTTLVMSGGSIRLPATNDGYVELKNAVDFYDPFGNDGQVSLLAIADQASATLSCLADLTNSGMIEMTCVEAGDPRDVRINMLSGSTLVNQPDGTIEVWAGTGGTRTISGLIDNQGTIGFATDLTLTSIETSTNSGTIAASAARSGGDLTISNFTSLDNSGQIVLLPGKTLYVLNGTINNLTGGVLNPGDKLDLINAVVSFADPYSTVSDVLLRASAIDGPGTISVVDGTTLTLLAPDFSQDATAVRAPLLNYGDVVMRSGSTHCGCYFGDTVSNEPGGAMHVVSGDGWGYCRVYVQNGLTNHGLIDMTSVGGAYPTYYYVAGGTLINETDGTISLLTGDGGDRFISGPVDNRGEITAGGNLTISRYGGFYPPQVNSGTISATAGTLLFDDFSTLENQADGVIQNTGGPIVFDSYLEGAAVTNAGQIIAEAGLTLQYTDTYENSGSINVSGGNLFLNEYLTFTNNGDITIAPDRVFDVFRGHVHLGPGATLTGAARINLNQATFSTDNDWSTGTSDVVQNVCPIEGPGTVTVSPGTTLYMQSPRFSADTTTIRAPLIVEGDVQMRSGVSHSGCYFADTVLNQPGGVMHVVGENGWGHGQAYFQNGLTNHSLVEMTSVDAAYASYLRVTGGLLVNDVDGAISVLGGDGGDRQIMGHLDNRGTITADTDLTISRYGGIFPAQVNSGTISATDGTLTISDFTSLTNEVDGVIANSNGLISLTSVVTVASMINAGEIHAGGGLSLEYVETSENNGLINVGGDLTLTNFTSFTNNGDITFAPGGRLFVYFSPFLMGPEATLSGGSHIELNSTTFTSDADWSTDTANVRQYASRIDGAGSLTVSPGTLLDVIAPRFTYDAATIAKPVVNEGTVQCRSGVSHSACYITGPVTNEPGGVIRVLGDGAWGHGLAYLTGGLTNRGEVELTTLTPGYWAAMGVSGGLLTNEPGGVIGGTGTLNVTATTFTNDGDVRPGDPKGLLYVSGAYNQSATGVLEIELGGYEAGVDADQLEVGQAATLAGTLRIALVDGFRPTAGDTFTIMTYASRSGSFDPVELVGFPPEAEVEVQFGSTAAVVEIISMPTIPGDVDGDGVVDVDDYVLFSDCLVGPDDPLPPDCETADVDGDSDVDLEDFQAMQIAFAG